MIDLSIIIISYNTAEITKKCLETVIKSLENADFKTEIIVLDNNSTDGSADMLKQAQISNLKAQNQNLKLKIILKEENSGFAKGNNEAVKQAHGKILLFLNSDIEVIDNAIPRLCHYFTSDENQFHFIGGKLLESDGQTPQASCGPFYSLPIVFAALFLRGDYWGLTRYSPNTIKEVDWISGACIMCRNDDFDKLQGFDENIFMYMDEIDLLYRARQTGRRVGFYPEAKFIHLGSASSQTDNKRTSPILQVYRGFLYFYKKHHSPLQIEILKFMLQLKALVALFIGKITGNQYLKTTYGQALEIIKNA